MRARQGTVAPCFVISPDRSLSGPYVEESHPPRDEDDPLGGLRRLDARQQSWGASLGCSEPAWVAVRNRLDHDLAWVPAE